MGYTTVAKIKSMFRNIDIEAATETPSTDTVITTEEVEQFIVDADAWIDNVLYPYYTTPITGTESLKVVDTISRYFAAHTIKGILELTKQTSDKEQDVQGNLGKRAKAMLDKLIPKRVKTAQGTQWVDAEAPLSDAPKKSVPPVNASLITSSSNTAVFTKGGANW